MNWLELKGLCSRMALGFGLSFSVLTGMQAAESLETALTRIAAEMTVDTALPRLTPRPKCVTGTEMPLMTLNGTWEFSAGKGIAFKPIQVPGEWVMQGFTVNPEETAVYRRVFNCPADWQGKRIKIRFDAVHSVCSVSVNGKMIGNHEGGFVPFEFDITDAAAAGDNLLTVRVKSESIADKVSCISQYAAHPVGGLIRKVTLFTVPDCYAASEKITAVPFEDVGIVNYHAEMMNRSGVPAASHMVFRVKNADGDVVSTEKTESIMLQPDSFTAVQAWMHVKSPKLWSSEVPYLYTLEITQMSGEKTLSVHTLRFGIREVKLFGNKMFVNGRPVKLLGVCRHEIHPLSGRSLSPELCRRDVELFRAANVNCIRTSHYPPSEEFLDACDELGVFVECEAAVCWIKHNASPIWEKWDYKDPKYFPYFLRPNLDQLAAYGNHPSIVMWSLANESLWSPLWAKVLETVKKIDPTRPFLFHDQCWGGYNNGGSKAADVANFHYPSESNPDMWSDAGRPVWFGEYVHVQCYNRKELATDPWIREDWGRPVARMVDLMWEQPGSLGGTVWNGIDDVFHLPDSTLCGYGHWGVIDGWRRIKPEYRGLQNAYTPFRILASETVVGKPIRMTIQNRHNFLNLSQDTITWRCVKPGDEDRSWFGRRWDGLFGNDRDGTLKLNIAPHNVGEAVIDGSFEDGDKLIVTVIDPRGVEVASHTLMVGAPALAVAQSGATQLVAIDPTSQQLSSPHFQIPFPVPMVLALNNAGGADGPAGRTLSNQIEPFTPVEAWTWHVDPANENRFTGTGTLGTGVLEFEKLSPKRIKINYSITVSKAVNPRQWGMVMTLPRRMDTLHWNRNNIQGGYSENDIGRPIGTATANPSMLKTVEAPGVCPVNPYNLDSNALGTNDFRSTKTDILFAGLSDSAQHGLRLRPTEESPLSVRSWVDQETIRFLAAAFNTGGADHFFSTHYAKERRPLKKDDTIKGSFILEMQ